jgi:hypothetical protein
MVRRASVLLAILFTVGGTAAQAQFQITPVAGYQFGGNFKSGSTYSAVVPDTLSAVSLAGGFQWGLILGYGFGDVFQLELQYDRQSTMLEIDEAVDPGIPELKLATNALQVGATLKAPIEVFRPFFTVSAGGTHIKPSEAGRESETYFSWAIGIGAMKMVSPRVGLRVQTRLLSTRLGSDEKSFCNMNDECFGYTTTTNLNQANLLGGIVVAF